MFDPAMENNERKTLVHGWNKAVRRSFGWIEKDTKSLEEAEEKKLAAELKVNHPLSPAAPTSSSLSSSSSSSSSSIPLTPKSVPSSLSTTVNSITSSCNKSLQSSAPRKAFQSLLLVAIGGVIGFSISKTSLADKLIKQCIQKILKKT
jgi:hypothetical protein